MSDLDKAIEAVERKRDAFQRDAKKAAEHEMMRTAEGALHCVRALELALTDLRALKDPPNG
jgi:hypothetical protein